ncbi:hypothetical protein AAG589_01845 [Isoptericola sp. F-RaC21]|uniref:hypothetical protein n=1 Tax=Isoptericola sp. F-RaC21 TaxID=3141452 RepID=UPI00315BCD66
MTDDSRSYAPDLARLTDAADDSFSVRRAYGEPYEHQGQLIIPVAKVWGGIGTGSGGGAGNGAANGAGTGTGSGSGRGTGQGKGDGSAPGWRRSFNIGSGGTDAAADEPADTADAGDAPRGGGSARGDASGEAQGDAKGELQGEAHGEGHGEGGGGGGGYGLRVKPLGVVVVSAEGTRYQPVLDLNRVILGGQVVGIAIALAAGWAIGRRRR